MSATLVLAHDDRRFDVPDEQIVLPGDEREVLDPEELPELAARVGHDIVTSDGTLWGMGSNAAGQLGDVLPTAGTAPVHAADHVVAIAAGASHSLLLKDDATLWGAGLNHFGQLGDGTQIARGVPVPITAGVAMAAAGNAHSLWVKTDGTLWAAGNNTDGQLGDGTRVSRPSPVNGASAST